MTRIKSDKCLNFQKLAEIYRVRTENLGLAKPNSFPAYTEATRSFNMSYE